MNRSRLWRWHVELAAFGAFGETGVNRQALSEEEFLARDYLARIGREFSLEPLIDPAGNFFLRLEGSDPTAAHVLTGSHIDSQPMGGRFDGVYGVLSGIEAIAAMREAGLRPRRSIEIVAWMNEEGSRFAPGMMGSSVYSGKVPLERFLDIRDREDITVAMALSQMNERFSGMRRRADYPVPHAYIEAHIEQAPVLHDANVPIGVVTGLQGKKTYRVTVHGREAHVGTTPMRERQDALMASIDLIAKMSAVCEDAQDQTRFSVGRLDLTPNAPSVIPAKAVFSIDLRHPDSSRLDTLGAAIEDVLRTTPLSCRVSVEKLTDSPTTTFSAELMSRIRDASSRCSLASIDLLSSAGHDSRWINYICPTAMIFIPSKDGISHHHEEYSSPEQLSDGASVLAEVIAELAQ